MQGIEINAKTQERTVVQVPDVCDAPVIDPRVEQLRQAYRDATRALCRISGAAEVDKLEDVEFVPVRQAAMVNSLVDAVGLCDTISYCLFQLYRLDGNDAWERI